MLGKVACISTCRPIADDQNNTRDIASA